LKKTIVVLLGLMLLPTFTFGHTAEFIVPHTYTASRDYSFNYARDKAMQEAQADLLRQLGVLVEARQRLVIREVDGISQEDFIEEAKTYTLGRVQTTIVDGTEDFARRDGGMVFSATFKMVVDTADLFGHLNDILAQRQQAMADSIAQIQQARADSLELVRNFSELELAVRTARSLLAQEQEKERPLRLERDRKERESQEAQMQKDNAQTAFDNLRNAADAHTSMGARRIENERTILQEATNYYNIKSDEFRIADENWKNAVARVETAQNNLKIAEDNLAQGIRTMPRVPEKAVVAEEPTNEIPINRFDSAFDRLEARKTEGQPTRESLQADFAAVMENNRQAPSIVSGNSFVFSIRPEFVSGTSVTGAGLAIELGTVSKNGGYFTAELNAGNYVGGGVNFGKCFNRDGTVKNVLGLSLGYRNNLYFYDFNINGEPQQSAIGTNTSIAGVFWKLMFGRSGNISVINRIFVGNKDNPVGYDVRSDRFIYEDGRNMTYIFGIGYTLTKARK
jgi:hypothetical protein